MPRHRKSLVEIEPRIPIKLGPFCSGEIAPRPLSEVLGRQEYEV